MHPNVYKVVVVPTLIGDGAFIGITTLGDESNYVNQLLEQRTPLGEKQFRHIHFDPICERCKKLEKVDSCIHKMGDLPHWMNKSRFKELEGMMGDNAVKNIYFFCFNFTKDDINRELRGLPGSSSVRPAFDKDSLDKLQRSCFQENSYQKHVFISIDPACGGSRSKYAIVSAFFCNGVMVVSAFFFYCF